MNAETVEETPAPLGISPRAQFWLSTATGIASAIVTLGVASVVAFFFGIVSPLVSVGQLVIDLVPAGVKTVVIAVFGTGDKAFLLVVLAVVVTIAAAFVGILQWRRPNWGVALLGVIGALSFVAAATRANATIVSVLPTVAGVFVGMLVLRALVRRLSAWQVASSRRIPRSGRAQGVVERRQFIRLALWSSIAAAVAGTGAQLLTSASAAVTAVRTRISLPTPATTVAPIPAGADLKIPGLSPWVIPNKDFYRIDTALQVPSIDPKTWKLQITGMVEKEIEITFAELLKLPLEEKYVTLACVSQEIGGNLIGNALWLGYPIRNLLAEAKPKAGADMVLSRSIDGFTAGTPLAVLQDAGTDAILAVGMNGEPLPIEHGFPVRMVVPGLYGYVSATKWVVQLKVTTFAKDEGYWTPRGWSALGPVKLSSRIDTPQQGATVKAGTVAVAGVAWRQHVGVSGVQVQIDKGAWQDAKLAKVVTVDSWLQWSFAWEAKPGQHTISVRAIDDTGAVQTAKFANPDPNGSTGHHTIQVSVG